MKEKKITTREKYFLKKLEKKGIILENISNYSKEDFEKIFQNLGTRGQASFRSNKALLKMFIKNNNDLNDEDKKYKLQLIDAISEDKFPSVNIYLSRNRLEKIVNDIYRGNFLNPISDAALIQLVFYGAYSEDLSTITNLSGEDINTENNTVLIKPNNAQEYLLKVPSSLAKDLKTLSETRLITRASGRGSFTIDSITPSPNSVFKVATLNDEGYNPKKHESVIRHRIKRIMTNFGYDKVTPKNIYQSGLIVKILEEVYNDNNDPFEILTTDTISPIIKEAILKIHYENGQNIMGRENYIYYIYKKIILENIEIFKEDFNNS